VVNLVEQLFTYLEYKNLAIEINTVSKLVVYFTEL